jgi:2'-5' RNA ligase
MAKIRTFIAVSISEKAREAVTEMINSLQNFSSGIRWVKPENMHLTLKFLGDVEEEKLPELEEALKLSAEKIKRFNYELVNVGCFPNYKRPRVLWVGVEDSENQLLPLHQNIESEFIKLGFPKESRKFKPHLTVARVKDFRKCESAISKFKGYNFGSYKNDVGEVVLMKSDLFPSGAKYTKLIQLQLN